MYASVSGRPGPLLTAALPVAWAERQGVFMGHGTPCPQFLKAAQSNNVKHLRYALLSLTISYAARGDDIGRIGVCAQAPPPPLPTVLHKWPAGADCMVQTHLTL